MPAGSDGSDDRLSLLDSSVPVAGLAGSGAVPYAAPDQH
jgi:hypothetical protein